MRKILFVASVLIFLSQHIFAQGFLQNLQKQLNSAGNATPSGGVGSGIGDMCPGYAPAKQKDLAGASAEQVVSKYFQMSADIEKRLLDGIALSRGGTLTSFDRSLEDLKDKEIKKLGQSFMATPSVPALAQIIAYAERGSGYVDVEKKEPAETAEAQALLAMVMMQYPNLVLNKEQVLALLKQSNAKESGLGTALIARAYLYGDYAPQNIETFSNYIAQASKNYRVKLADQSIFYALEKVPNWKYKDQYLNLLQQSQEMQKSFQRQQSASKSTDTFKRAINLMREGEKIDQITLEALGAGPKIAELRAKGEMLRKEGKGEANLIEIEVNQSSDYQREVNKLIATNPKLTDEAKVKLEKANKLKVDNLSSMRAIQAEVLLKLFSGDLGATMEIGGAVNHYYHNACNVAVRQLDLSKQIGVPQPAISSADLAKGSL